MELSVNKLRSSLHWLRELLQPVELTDLQVKTLNDLTHTLNHCPVAQSTLENLFAHLSNWIVEAEFTLPIAVAFEEYLMLIITRNLQHAEETTFIDYQRNCVALAKLMQLSVEIKQYASNYFRNQPAPFDTQENNIRVPKCKKSRKMQVEKNISSFQLIKCCYQLLRTDLAYFKALWNWSTFIEKYCNERRQKTNNLEQLYCNHIVAMLTNMTLKQLSELNVHITAEVLLQFDAVQDKINDIVAVNPYITADTNEELVCYKIPTDLQVTNIEGVVLPIFNQANYNFYTATDGAYDTIVKVDSTKINLRSLALGIAASKAICLSGPVGCGKTTLVEYLARKTGRICPKFNEIARVQKHNKENETSAQKQFKIKSKPNIVGNKRSNDIDEDLNELTANLEQHDANGFLRIQLGDQTDSKMLLGQYRCTDVPGEFVWLPGVLTQAVMNGYWLLLEDLDAATQDTYTILSSLLEHKLLSVPGFRDCVKIEPGFQLFVTVRTNKTTFNAAQKSLYTLLEKYLYTINILPLSRNELCKVVSSNYPKLSTVANRIVDVYLTFSSGYHAAADNLRQQETVDKADTTDQYVALPFEQVTLLPNSGRLVSTRDLIKLCQRSNPVFSVTSTECAYFVFQNAVDVFCAYLPQSKEKTKLITSIGAKLGIIQSRCEHFSAEYKPDVEVDSLYIKVGRAALDIKKNESINEHNNINGQEMNSFALKRQKLTDNTEKSLKYFTACSKSTFSFTRLAVCILERIAVCVAHAEPVLLVGETGVGKTSSVQYLAERTKHKLVVVNMNNQSDVSDLVGGFKPVDLTYVLAPLRTEFELLFRCTFNEAKNAIFLQKYAICYNQGNFEVLVKLMLKIVQNLMEKQQKQLLSAKELQCWPRWQQLQLKLLKLNTQLAKAVNISFAFIPGSLVNCIKNGDWVLLDEINLASAETLECLSTILEPDGSVVLLEKGDFEPVKRHADFRIFACMNPNTDIGKKDLPVGIRNRFTEFFVDELTTDADLSLLVSDYLAKTGIQRKSVTNIVKLYKKLKQMSKLELNDGLGNRPVYSLRTLCRALSICAKNLCGSIERNLYESLCLSFLTQLDDYSHANVLQLIQSALVSNVKAVLGQSIPKPGENYLNFEGYWIQQGSKSLLDCENYILTNSVRKNLSDLARIIAIGKLPVLLQGPTSAGKTSLIEYVAKKSGNYCLRINNHEHTDLQEYIGTYAADVTGKLSFREGVLVQAMRHGYWIILDELNLASTDILEALNRVLDDNRELYIAETQTVIKAHANFMLFATQNPPGLYGGRKTLSRAFKNRFIELHFNDIPKSELESILEKRCLIPASYAKKMVNCMSDLQKHRTTTSKNIFTLRDLFRWGNRYTYADKSLLADGQYDWNQHLIEEGFLVLSAKVRTNEEIEIIKQTLYNNFRKRINLARLFDINSADQSLVTASLINAIKEFKLRTDIVWTLNMTKMAVLTAKALQFNEPVLLVGPTGCGKTTVCQLLASIKGVALRILNCHMHTEGADFLGGLRPCRQHNDSNKLFEWADGPLIEAMQDGSYFMADEISLAEDSVLERLNCILEPERTVLLAEKGGVTEQSNANDLCNDFVVKAKEGFQFLATMNPGGDFGKKELSPALRNRFTEIWCQPSDNKQDLIAIAGNCILEQYQKTADKAKIMQTASYLVEIVLYIYEIVEKFKFSVRDILAWANYMVNNAQLSFAERAIFGLETIFLDALEMLPHESSEKLQHLKQNIIEYAIKQADLILHEKFSVADITAKRGITVIANNEQFGLQPFLIARNKNAKLSDNNNFLFEAPTTKQNLFRLLSALSLQKPVLLEGPPGVGKTSIVESLAAAIGYNIVRINLCEHTDLADLFGTDLPAEDNALFAEMPDQDMNHKAIANGNDMASIGAFVWRDGPLLAALKASNTWILLDELNLAPQSVLEGLNAILDHRGEVYIPELNKTFALQNQTRIFACQNPLKQGGGRKGLPQSFLNRFNKVYLRKLNMEDLRFVIDSQYKNFFEQIRQQFLALLQQNNLPAVDNLFDLYHVLKNYTEQSAFHQQQQATMLDFDLAERLVKFSERLDQGIANMEFGYKGGPFEINLRDILRWCELLANAQTGIIFTQSNTDFCVAFENFMLTLYERMKLVYYQRMRCEQDKSFIRNTFASIFNCEAEQLNELSEDICLYWSDENIYLNDIVLPRCGNEDVLSTLPAYQSADLSPLMLSSQRELLKNIVECVHLQKPVLLCGATDTGKTKLIDTVCTLSNQVCNTDNIDDSVTGSFQQIDLNRHLEQISQRVETILLRSVQNIILAGESIKFVCKLFSAWSSYSMLTQSKLNHFNSCNGMSADLILFRQRLIKLKQVIVLLLETCQDNIKYTNNLKQQQQILAALEQHVRKADSLNTGGSFEWVDSKIVKALKNGEYLLLEHVNLCSSAVLDRLNPVFEPNGKILISEKGVTANQSAEIVEKAANFRAFLTSDPKNGELSRAMRNRCIELSICKEQTYNNDDLSQIVYNQGVQQLAAIQCILNIHQRMQQLSEISSYNVSHLMQFAFLVASYKHIGYDLARALYVSAMEVYVYAANTDLLGFGLAFYQNKLREIVLEETEQYSMQPSTTAAKDMQLAHSILNSSNLTSISLIKWQMVPLQLLLQNSQTLLKNLSKELNAQQLTRCYLYLLYDCSCFKQLELQHLLLKQLLATENAALGNFADKLYVCLQQNSKEFKSVTVDLPWNSQMLPRLRDYALHTTAIDKEKAYGLSASLLLHLLLQEVPTTTNNKKLSQMTFLQYSQAVASGNLTDKLNNEFLANVSTFLLQLQKLLQASIQDAKLDANAYAQLSIAYLWFNRMLHVLEQPLFVQQALDRDMLDKLLLHFKWLQKHLMQHLQRILPAFSQKQKMYYKDSLAQLEKYIISVKHPLNLLQKTYAKQIMHFQPFYLEQQLQKHKLYQKLDKLLQVVPDYGNISRDMLLFKFQAQKSIEALRSKAQLTREIAPQFDYNFKIVEISDTEHAQLPQNLKLCLQQFMHTMQKLQDLPRTTNDIDVAAILNDIELLQQQEKAAEREEEDNQIQIKPQLNDIELSILPLNEYYLNKAISSSLSRKTLTDAAININFYEQIPSLSCASLHLIKLLENDKFKCFYKIWLTLLQHLPQVDFAQLIAYLNGSYREFSSFARLIYNAYYCQQLENLSMRITCTQFQHTADAAAVCSSYNYEGPALSNALIASLCNTDGSLKSMSLQNLDSWRDNLKKIHQLLWHNVNLICEPYAVSSNNLQLATQNVRKLLIEVKYVQELCQKQKAAYTDFEKLLHKLETQLADNELAAQPQQIQYNAGMLHALMGAIELNLLTFMPLIDPVEKQRLKNAYLDEDINTLQHLNAAYDCMRDVLHYKHFGAQNYAAFTAQLNMLCAQREKSATNVAFRPETCLYSALVQDIKHFLHTNCTIVKLLKLITDAQLAWQSLNQVKLSVSNLSEISECLYRMELWISNAQHFLHNKLQPYMAYYEDLLQPLQCAVQQLRFGFESLKSVLQQKQQALVLRQKPPDYINCDEQKRLQAVLENIVAFPTAIKLNIYNEQAPRNIFANRAQIFSILEPLKHSERIYIKLLQAKLSELQQFAHINKSLTAADFQSYDFALHICNEVWQTEETQRRKLQAEEESLYVQKTKCAEEDEEMLELQEISEHFPTNAEADFGEFIEQDTLEQVMKLQEKPLKKQQNCLFGDEEYNFVAENFMHIMLHYTKSYYNANKAAPTTMLNLLQTFQQRFKVFVQLFNYYKTALNDNLDAAAYYSFAMAVALQQQQLHENDFQTNKKCYNYYKDTNVAEVSSCMHVLQQIKTHVLQQLELYPEHATLLDILRVIARIKQLPANATLVRFNMGFQLLRQKVAQWNEVAHSGNNLRNEEIIVAEHVQRWTRLELQCWRNCLQQAQQKINTHTYRYWFFIYNLLQEYLAQRAVSISLSDMKYAEQRFADGELVDDASHETAATKITLQHIVRILRQFVESANYGDFAVRLQLLNAFELYLHNMQTYAAEDTRLPALIATMRNIQIYFAQFSEEITTACEDMRKPIEKKLKEFVKIESYNKDLSYFSMRNNVARVHRQLNKFMRDYRLQLQQKITSVLQPREIIAKDYQFNADKHSKFNANCYMLPEQKFVAAIKLRQFIDTKTEDSADMLINRIDKLFMNSRNVVKSTVQHAVYPKLILALNELFETQLQRCENLRSLSVDRKREKPQQKAEAKQILQQKRKALVDLFKILTQMGVSYKSGLLELGLRTEFADYQLPPFCLSNILSNKPGNLAQLCENINNYFAKCVFKLRLLQNIMLAPLSELGPPTIERIKGNAVDLFLIVQNQRSLLSKTSNNAHNLHMNLKNLHELALANNNAAELAFAETHEKFLALQQSLCQMRYVFEQMQQLLNCVPNTQTSETQVFMQEEMRFVKNSTEFIALEQLCSRVLQLSKNTLEHMQQNQLEFLSYQKLSAYRETHEQLLQLIKQFKDMLKVTGIAENEVFLPLVNPLNDLLKFEMPVAFKEQAKPIQLTEIPAAVEKILQTVLMALQKLYKKYAERKTSSQAETTELQEEELENDIEDQHIRQKLLAELSTDAETLNLAHITEQLSQILLSLKYAPVSMEKLEHCRQVVSMIPLLEQYKLMVDYYLCQQLGAHNVCVKLLSVLLTVFVEIGMKGFCVPPDLMQDEENEKKGEQKEGEGFGLEDGTGEKDASDKLESEDQLDDAKRPEDRKNEDDKNQPDCKEEKGIEMSEDFDSKLQDIEKPEDDDSAESEEEEELNKEMDETEEGAEKLDDQIWGDDEEPEAEEEEENEMKDEDNGKGTKDEKDAHNDLDSKNDAAKEDGKNDEEKNGLDATDEPSGEDKRKQQEKDIDHMKDQEGEEEEHANPYHNELEEPPEAEEMDLGDVNNDKEEEHDDGDEREGEENPFDIDRMKENMQPTEEMPDNNDEEKTEEGEVDNNENGNSDDSDSEPEVGTDIQDNEVTPENEQTKEENGKDIDEDENVIEENEAETQKRGDLEEQEKEQKEEQEEKPCEDNAQSKDKSSKEENLQTMPETDKKSSADQAENEMNDKDVKQEDKLDEQDTGKEKDGVGQAENEEQDSGHKGIAETKETLAQENSKNERKPQEKRKQGRTDEERTLGEAEKNKLKQLKTIDKLKKQNEENDKNNDNAEEQDDEMEAEEYQHVKEPKSTDKTTLDNATEEQSKQIQHQEDEDKDNKAEDDAENIDELTMNEDDAMDVDNKDNEELEELAAEKLEPKSDKPSKSEKSKERAEMQQEQVEVEGEYAVTSDVSRGTDTTAHCQKEILLNNTQAEELSASETLELRRQYQQQITTNIAAQPNHDDYETWKTVSQRMSQSARELCEQLRLILEPTKCTRLKGDYRTGRRINMKKIIPYIASQFRKDKIWLRRTKPAQRDYKITIAIDDSKSMHHNNSKTLTLEAISLVSQALTLLESGRLSVVSFGEQSKIVLNHTEQFDGPKLVNALNFAQDKTKIAELLDFVRIANSEEGISASDNGLFENLLLILSDGRNIFGEGKLKVQNSIKLARLQRIFLVYIIIDSPENKNSIFDIQTMEMLPDKRITIKSYLDDFPFPYYVIVRDLNQLPLVLSEAMRQWFELVNSEQ